MNYEYINNSNLDGMSLASFCQSRAVIHVILEIWMILFTPPLELKSEDLK